MKKILTHILPAILLQGTILAQGKPLPGASDIPTSEKTDAQISAETRAILQERKLRDLEADRALAMKLQDENEARLLVDAILAEENARAADAAATDIARQRLAEAGRTEEARKESIAYLRSRLSGKAASTQPPDSFRSRQTIKDPETGDIILRTSKTHFYDNNRRVVTYRNMDEVPPVLIAYSKLSYVEIQQLKQRADALAFLPVERRPAEYIAAEAFSVSYAVDPNSEVTRDDILFVQGSTAFQDAYSFDLVQDIAMAINDPTLANESFVIEGHASAEGDFASNLALSQARAERIVREMVNYGVSPSRLVPVGFGDNDATYLANSAENLRTLDRRVAVYRLVRSTAVKP